MTLKLSDIQQADLGIRVVDKAGNPAIVDGSPSWASSDEAVATVQAAPDGMTATVVATGALGTAQVSVQADADLGEGVTPLVGVLDVEVVASAAVGLDITTGTPVDKP